MPNIEIHGLPLEKAEALQKTIFILLSCYDFYDHAVVTIYPTWVRDHHNREQPFLRIVSSSTDDAEDIIKVLGSLKMDMEFVLMRRFVPKEKEKKKKPEKG